MCLGESLGKKKGNNSCWPSFTKQVTYHLKRHQVRPLSLGNLIHFGFGKEWTIFSLLLLLLLAAGFHSKLHLSYPYQKGRVEIRMAV